MESYTGVGPGKTIHGGGTFVTKRGWGSEIYNDKAYKGRLYGGLFPGRHKNIYKGIRLENLGASLDDSEIKGVTVVWVARRRSSGGTYVVGWYKNATVHRNEQDAPAGSKRNIPKQSGKFCGYFVEANAKNGKFIESDLRTALVPRGKNGMGQANIWYPASTHRGKQFLQQIKTLILTGTSPPIQKAEPKLKSSHPRQSNLEQRQKIERMAMEFTTRWYENHGYKVIDVSKVNSGWDLEAVNKSNRGTVPLLLEVRGFQATRSRSSLHQMSITK